MKKQPSEICESFVKYKTLLKCFQKVTGIYPRHLPWETVRELWAVSSPYIFFPQAQKEGCSPGPHNYWIILFCEVGWLCLSAWAHCKEHRCGGLYGCRCRRGGLYGCSHRAEGYRKRQDRQLQRDIYLHPIVTLLRVCIAESQRDWVEERGLITSVQQQFTAVCQALS